MEKGFIEMENHDGHRLILMLVKYSLGTLLRILLKGAHYDMIFE